MNEPEQDDYTPLSEEVVHEPKCHRVDSMNPEHAICTCRPATIRTYPRGITAISRADAPKAAPFTISTLLERITPLMQETNYEHRWEMFRKLTAELHDAGGEPAEASEFYATFTHPTQVGEGSTALTVSVDIASDGRALLNLDDLHPLMEAAGFEMTRPGWLDNPSTPGHEPQDASTGEPEL